MELFVFLDLDDTIFQTKRKCPPNTQITPAAFAKDGSPMSFFTPKQQRFFNLLSHKTRLIPTTARDYQGFSRANIREYDYAIINHGGIILHADGTPHTGWFMLMRQQLNLFTQALCHIEQLLQTTAQEKGWDLKIRLIRDMELTFYCLIKQKNPQHNLLVQLLKQVVQPYLAQHKLDFYCHLNDNNLAILPKMLNKAHAVAFLQKELNAQYADYLSFGMGDSLSDIPYMQFCDYFITPKNSQIVRERITSSYHIKSEL